MRAEGIGHRYFLALARKFRDPDSATHLLMGARVRLSHPVPARKAQNRRHAPVLAFLVRVGEASPALSFDNAQTSLIIVLSQVRGKGIEPLPSVWKTDVLPLY